MTAGQARRVRGAALALAAAAVLVACGSSGPEEPGGAEAPQGSSPVPSAAQDDVNPVVDNDFPDPDVLKVDDVYYAYATNANTRNVQVSRSQDLVDWETLPDALPELSSWVIPGKTWAPEVTETAEGTYVMYPTLTNYRPTLQCIAVATATSPQGPFTIVGEEMLVCPQDEGGAIDAATFQDDDGSRYLLWKNDGNCCGLDTWLSIAPLSTDGLRLIGESTRLLMQDLSWEGHLIEAPTLVKRDGQYVLLYSANDYGGPEYAIGYATAESLLGPYTKNAEPLLSTEMTAGKYVGPGGQDVVRAPDGSDYLVFHSWYLDRTYRGMNVLPLSWADGEPVVDLNGSVSAPAS